MLWYSLEVLNIVFLLELTIAGQNDYWDTITNTKSTIAILLLLQVPIAITIGKIICLKRTRFP